MARRVPASGDSRAIGSSAQRSASLCTQTDTPRSNTGISAEWRGSEAFQARDCDRELKEKRAPCHGPTYEIHGGSTSRAVVSRHENPCSTAKDTTTMQQTQRWMSMVADRSGTPIAQAASYRKQTQAHLLPEAGSARTVRSVSTTVSRGRFGGIAEVSPQIARVERYRPRQAPAGRTGVALSREPRAGSRTKERQRIAAGSAPRRPRPCTTTQVQCSMPRSTPCEPASCTYKVTSQTADLTAKAMFRR